MARETAVSSSTPESPRGARRGLTRNLIVDKALAIGDAEGLEAVTIRRVAQELGVTSMALYRHVRDKDGLLNAMLEAVIAEGDLTRGIEASMPWQEQLRRGLANAVDMLTARRVTLPLQIAYQGPITPVIARPYELTLGILLKAGFAPREAVAFARMLPILLAGLLTLYREGPAETPDRKLRLRLRRYAELQVMDLPEAEFPMLRRHARLLGETMVADTRRGIENAVEFFVAGLESQLHQARRKP